jgi:hypothetical protein
MITVEEDEMGGGGGGVEDEEVLAWGVAFCCDEMPVGLGGFGGGGPRLCSGLILLLSTPTSAPDLLSGIRASQCACVAASSWSPRSVKAVTHTASPAASAMNAPTPHADTADTWVDDDDDESEGDDAGPRAADQLCPEPWCWWVAAAASLAKG